MPHIAKTREVGDIVYARPTLSAHVIAMKEMVVSEVMPRIRGTTDGTGVTIEEMIIEITGEIKFKTAPNGTTAQIVPVPLER